jgi:CRP/FNR family transcriptional regulator
MTHMTMNTDILLAYGAVVNRLKKNTMIYRQDEKARFYFQVLEGEVKTYNLSQASKEYVHGLFSPGESFGEPSFFLDEPYPANALATKDSVIIKVNRDIFHQILLDHPEIQMHLLRNFAQKLYDKSMAARMLNQSSPEDRIMDFLMYYKKKTSKSTQRIQIPFTRQELASQTGLRIETVIRTLRKLSESGKVEIIDHKVYF